MKSIKLIECACGEEVYEDDRCCQADSEKLACINCHTIYDVNELKEIEIAEIKETKIG